MGSKKIKTKQQYSSTMDTLKWALVLVLIVAGIGAYYYFSKYLMFVRVLGLLFVFLIAGFIAFKTEKGRTLFFFAREAKQEVSKVVWPTRQETVQTTLMVMVMVLIMGVILWLFDSILLHLIAWVTGHKGA